MASISDASNDNFIKDDDLGHILAPFPDFQALARGIQNRGARRIGTDLMEARHFVGFLGINVVVVKKVWELLERDSLLPEGCEPKHLLWALHFM